MPLPAPIPTARSRGFTLAELVVVLLIVAATAGIAGLLLSGTTGKAQEDTVRVSFLRIQAAIYGAEGRPGYYHDLGYPPKRLVDLLRRDAADPLYDPSTRKGWNGPYLVSNGTIPAAGTPEFADLEARGYVVSVATNPHYHLAGEPALLDPLGRPYVLHPPFDPGAATPPWVSEVRWGGPDETPTTVRTAVGDPPFSDFLTLTEQ